MTKIARRKNKTPQPHPRHGTKLEIATQQAMNDYDRAVVELRQMLVNLGHAEITRALKDVELGHAPVRGPRGTVDSPATRALIIMLVEKGYTKKMACDVAGVAYRTLRDWTQHDADFKKQMDDAYEIGTDVLEEAVRKRAIEGHERPIYQGGELVGHERVFSDRLAELLLTGRRANIYGKQRHEVSGPNGAPMAHSYKMEVEFIKPKGEREED